MLKWTELYTHFKQNKMNRLLLLFILQFGFLITLAQPPEGYYSAAEDKTGKELMEALHNIIKNHTNISYSGLWNAFYETDVRVDEKVWDMYSNCNFTFGTDQDTGSGGTTECDKYNREHSFPRSWFGGEVEPMNSDLFHIYPTDKKVNAVRGNYPFGEVASATYTSSNGSKLGSSSISGYTGTVFEPIDEYKGDFARTYFYMATRYFDIMKNWTTPITNKTQHPAFDEWVITMLLEWHKNDAVSDKERNRNNVIFSKYQYNRNPFIDDPTFAAKIWESTTNSDITNKYDVKLKVYPNPADISVNLSFNYRNTISVSIYNLIGSEVYSQSYANNTGLIEIGVSELPNGLYLVRLKGDSIDITNRFVIAR
jgi:endonuclease I